NATPGAVFNIRAVYWYVVTFGIFNHLQGFDSPRAEHDDDLLDDIEKDQRLYASGAHLVNLQAVLQGKVGPIAVRDTFQFEYQDIEGGPEAATVFYSTVHDLLLPRTGFTIQNDAEVLWLFDFGLVTGIRHTYVQTFYDDSDYAAMEDTDDPNSPIHKLGLLAAWTLWDEPGTRFNK